MRKTRAKNQERNLEREGEVTKNTRHKSGKKFREDERICEKHAPKIRKEISRGRENLRKTRAKNQGRNFERERDVTKNARHKAGEKFREGERSYEKHAPNFVNISGTFIILIPKYTAFIEIKEDN